MRSSQKRTFTPLIGVALLLALAAAALVQRPVATLVSAIQSYQPAYQALARIARLRSFLLAPPAERRSEAAELKNYVEAHPPLPDRIRLEMNDLPAVLSADPEQGKRFEQLSGLVRRRFAAGDPARAGDEDGGAPQIEGLLDEMEQKEGARLRSMDAVARSSMRQLMLLGAIGGFAAVLIILFALSLTQWEVARRRRTARSVTRLVAQQQKLTDRLDYLDKYDPLTGLPNRRKLLEMLEQEILWAKEGSRFLSVLITDVNRLKHINDLFGPETGDDVLKQIAERLQAEVGDRDIVARFAGGEFAIVLLDASRPVDAAAKAGQIQRAVSENIAVGDHDFVVTSTTGIAVYPDHGHDAQTLLRNADFALAKARSLGRNTIQVFDDHINRVISELFVLEKRLFSALKNGEYLVHYQPCCDLATNQVTGAEALIKWKDSDLGVISASRFIPMLEDTGMIIDVGKWVLETACGQIREWQAKERLLPVSVNLSLVQFRDKYLVEMVADAIGAFKLDPRHLTLEVTESVCLQDIEFAIKTMKRLKDMGVSLSVDDFGTGYSSLSYLKRLPVDSVKIDISFVRDVTRDPDTASIVTAITGLARSLRLKTVAEGVETEEQRKILHLLRCDLGQGFLFSPALPAAQYESFAARERSLPAEHSARPN